MDLPNAVVEFSRRSTKTEAGEIRDARNFLTKDAGDYSLADRNSDSTSDGTENVDALAELNGWAL